MKSFLPARPPRDAEQCAKALRGIFVLATDLAGKHIEACAMRALPLDEVLSMIFDIEDGNGDVLGGSDEAQRVFHAVRTCEPLCRLVAELNAINISIDTFDYRWTIGKACENCVGRCSCRTRYIVPAWRQIRRLLLAEFSAPQVFETKPQVEVAI